MSTWCGMSEIELPWTTNDCGLEVRDHQCLWDLAHRRRIPSLVRNMSTRKRSGGWLTDMVHNIASKVCLDLNVLMMTPPFMGTMYTLQSLNAIWLVVHIHIYSLQC